jgi:hypothetical protein
MRRRSNNYIYTDSNYTRISGKQINIIIMAAIIGLVVFMTRTKGFGMDSLFGNRANS